MSGDDEESAADELRTGQFRELTGCMMDLMVSIGLFNSVADNWPPDVQANWAGKIQSMIEWANQEIGEVQDFAEFFDD